MFGWFKKEGKKIEELESSLKNSFQNMRSDMSHVSQWISHFKTKHDEHSKNIESLHLRLAALESLLETKQAVLGVKSEKVRVQEELEEEEENDLSKNTLESSVSPPTQGQWDELTPTLKIVCNKLAGLKKESPRGWVSMKSITREMYPKRDYGAMRSTMSQFISTLEVHGFVERKRVGKQAYIYLLDLKKEKKGMIQEKTKK